MIPDIRFEAAFLRAALLLGLIDEREVNAWAEALLETATESVGLLAEVALAQPELTTVREALRPLAEPSTRRELEPALLAFLAIDPVAAAFAAPDWIRLLEQLRREEIFSPTISSAIKRFKDRWMLASAGVSAQPSLSVELHEWLTSARGTAYYRISLECADERAALLGALSRKVVRDRRVGGTPQSASRAWMIESPSGAGRTLVLNEPLWRTAVVEFSPLPLGSRIPYARVPVQALLVLDEATAEPMGADEANHRLSAV